MDAFLRNLETFKALRDRLSAAQRQKSYQEVIAIGLEIIEFSAKAPDLQIHTPIVHKRVANAFLKLSQPSAALEHYVAAHDGLVAIRAKGSLSNPDDWLDEIALLERAMKKLA